MSPVKIFASQAEMSDHIEVFCMDAGDERSLPRRTLIGRAFRKHRDRLGMSQHSVAQRLAVDIKTIQRIEAGRCFPSLKTLDLAAELFGATLDEMAGRTDADRLAPPTPLTSAIVPDRLGAVEGYVEAQGQVLEQSLGLLVALAIATGHFEVAQSARDLREQRLQ